MTDELTKYGEGSYTSDFVSGGPKTYAYRVYSIAKNTKVEFCKIKGLTSNLNTCRRMNFDTFKSMVLKSATTTSSVITSDDGNNDSAGELEDEPMTYIEIYEQRIRRTA